LPTVDFAVRDDISQTFAFGTWQGSYPGMTAGHTFNVVIVTGGHGVGGETTEVPDKAIQYKRAKIAASF
jgi:hypothetical protein